MKEQQIKELEQKVAELQQKVRELREPEETYGIGNRFKLHSAIFRNDTYLLCRCQGASVLLVDVESGNAWSKPVNVSNVHEITNEEMDLITDGRKFVKL